MTKTNLDQNIHLKPFLNGSGFDGDVIKVFFVNQNKKYHGKSEKYFSENKSEKTKTKRDRFYIGFFL